MTIGVLLAAGGGASACSWAAAADACGRPGRAPGARLGDPVEPDVLPSAVGLVWRALVLWLLVILLSRSRTLAP
jgi:adenosylcobinamide-phosphate synthase